MKRCPTCHRPIMTEDDVSRCIARVPASTYKPGMTRCEKRAVKDGLCTTHRLATERAQERP